MGMNTASVQRLYVAYFNRPADPVSLAVYEGMLPADRVATQAELLAVAETYFSPSAEYTANFEGKSNSQIVDQLYQNIFGRTAEADGLISWATKLTEGSITVAELALQLSYSAQGTDATVVAARIEAATAFTNGLDTAEEITGYSGNAAAAEGRAYLAQISGATPTDDATINAQKDAAITNVDTSIAAAVAAGNAVEGSTYTLTTSADTGAAFTGTAGNDTFVSTASTLTTGDDLNGGTGGTDVLTYTADLTAASAEGGFTLTNFDEMAFNLTDGAATTAHALTINALNAGAINFKLSGSTATNAFDDSLVLNNVAAGATLEMNNSTNFNLTADYVAAATSGTADAVSLTVNGMASAASTGVVTVGTGGGTGFETVNIASTGSASTIGALVSGATTINVSGAANLTVTENIENTTDVLNAASLTGNLSVTLANTGGERPDGDAVNDLADLTVTGGAGNDTIDGTALATTTLEYAIYGGAGNDTITIGDTPDNASTTNVGDVYAGGDGTADVLVADVDLVDTTAVTTALTGVSGFETLSLVGFGGSDETVTVANIQADLDTVAISGTNAGARATTINFGTGGTYNLSVGTATGALTDDTLTVTASGTGTSDTLNISNGFEATTTSQIGDADTNITTTGFETVNLNTGSYNTATAQLVNAVNVGTAGTLSLSGSNGLTTKATTGIITAKVVDAGSMTGALTMNVAAAAGLTTLTGGSAADTLRGDAASTINGGGGNDSIFGGAGNDVLNGDGGDDTITANAGSDTINGGLGNDTIEMGANLSALDVIDGGDGTDTLSVANGSLTALQSMTLSEANAFNAALTSVETLTIADGLDSTNDSFDLGRLDGISTVNIGTIITDAETLSGFDSGDTLNITKSTTNDLTVVVNSAATGATDVINIGLTAAGTSDAETLTIANVETVNITAAESPANALVRAATLGLTLSQTTVAAGGSGAAQTVNILGTENVIFDTAVAAGTINASGMTVAAATQAGLTMNSIFTKTTAITGQTVTGSGGADVLYGSTGADTFAGGAGNDVIHAGAGADVIDGGAGTGDTFHTTGMVGGSIEGAATGTSVGVVINLGTTAITDNTINNATGDFLGGGATSVAAGTVMYTFDTASDLFAGTTDTITNVENVTLAGNGVNYVQMNDSANTVVGGSGKDTIIAGGGADVIDAKGGADSIDLTETTGAIDAITAGTGESVAATAKSKADTGVFAVADTITFGNGVDIITGFDAAGGDTIDVGTAGAAETLIGETVEDLTDDKTLFASGTYNTVTGVFTIAADGTGADTLIFDTSDAGDVDSVGSDSVFILIGVDSGDLVAGTFI